MTSAKQFRIKYNEIDVYNRTTATWGIWLHVEDRASVARGEKSGREMDLDKIIELFFDDIWEIYSTIEQQLAMNKYA